MGALLHQVPGMLIADIHEQLVPTAVIHMLNTLLGLLRQLKSFGNPGKLCPGQAFGTDNSGGTVGLPNSQVLLAVGHHDTVAFHRHIRNV